MYTGRDVFFAFQHIIEVMEQQDLLEITNKNGKPIQGVLKPIGRLTPHGNHIRETTTWTRYLEEHGQEQKIDKTIKVLTLRQLQGNIFQIKYWWVIVIIAAILGEFMKYFVEVIIKTATGN